MARPLLDAFLPCLSLLQQHIKHTSLKDEKTGEIRCFAVFNFKKRTENLKDIDVPLPVKLKISA